MPLFFHVAAANLVRIARARTQRIDERPLVGRELSRVIAVSSRAFFDDPFFTLHAARRRPCDVRAFPYFFRSVYTHMGPHGRIVTVRDEADEVLGVAAWLTTGGYPLPIGVQLSQMPSSLASLLSTTTAR